MREIKFRAFIKVASSGLPVNRMDYLSNQQLFEWEADGVGMEIMQFTGLKDKNGVEIYEGDLISFGDEYWLSFGTPDIKEVVFDEDSASFRIYDYTELQGSALAEKWFIDDMIDCIEVIGNIHENPELMNYL